MLLSCLEKEKKSNRAPQRDVSPSSPLPSSQIPLFRPMVLEQSPGWPRGRCLQPHPAFVLIPQ